MVTRINTYPKIAPIQSDEDLVNAWKWRQEGDRSAEASLVDYYAGKLDWMTRHIYKHTLTELAKSRISRDEFKADMSMKFLKILRFMADKLNSSRPVSANDINKRFHFYLYKACRNQAIDYNRAKTTNMPLTVDSFGAAETIFDRIESRDPGPVQSLIAEENERLQGDPKLEEWVRTSLAPKYAEVFILHWLQGKNTQQIGEILGLGEPAAKSRLHRARAMLKANLHELDIYPASANRRIA